MSTSLSDLKTTACPSQAIPPAHRSRKVLGWAVLACILLSGSGLVRIYQDNQRLGEKIFRQRCPINMSNIPKKLGNWEMVSGGEDKLDELTMRIAGGTDHIIRSYANKFTGVSLSFLLLYGPAEPVSPHTPEVCYPASGFASRGDAANREIKFKTREAKVGQVVEQQAQFKSASYSKVSGRFTIHEVVYYAFRLDGKWANWIGGRKLMRRNPGIFKLQVQRRIGDREIFDQGDPIEDFLAALLSEIEIEMPESERKPDDGQPLG